MYVAPTEGSLTLLAPEVLACYMSLDITKLENVITQMSHILMTDVFTFTQKRDRSELEEIKVTDVWVEYWRKKPDLCREKPCEYFAKY